MPEHRTFPPSPELVEPEAEETPATPEVSEIPDTDAAAELLGSVTSAVWLTEPSEDRLIKRRATGAALMGIGAAVATIGGVLGGMGALGDAGVFSYDVADNAIDSSAGRAAGAAAAGLSGGVLAGVGAWVVSQHYFDPGGEASAVKRRKYGERRRDIRITSGVLLGTAGVLLAGAVGMGVGAAVLWNRVPEDNVDSGDITDAENSTKLSNITLAVGAAFPAVAATGIGLLVGSAARRDTSSVSITPMLAGSQTFGLGATARF